MVDALIHWAARAIHVFGAALWVGGFAVMLAVLLMTRAPYAR